MAVFPRLTAVLLSSTLAWPAAAIDFIIEARPQGKNFDRYSEISGSWRDSDTPPSFAKSSAPGLTPQGTVGSRKLIVPGAESLSAVSSDGTLAQARFTPDFPVPGRYHVYVTWPKAGNAMPVEYTVRHAAGTNVVSLMQDGYGAHTSSGNGNQWHPLGRFDFSPGKEHYVEVRVPIQAKAPHPKNATQAFCDAVCFSTEPHPSAALPNAALLPSIPEGNGNSAPQTTAGSTTVTWFESLDQARSIASREKKQILVFFFARDNPRSAETAVLLADSALKELLQTSYIPVRLDIQAHADLAAHLHVYQAGTISVYSSNGAALGQVTSPSKSAQELAAKLQSLGASKAGGI